MAHVPQIKIPATYMRGGTSKGVFFRLQDLPEGQRMVFLKADEGLPYSEVMKVMDLCREAGVEEVALIAERAVQG